MNEEVLELIGRRRRQVLVHACIYYRLNNSIVDDHKYDGWAKELARLQNEYPTEAAAAPLAEEFKEFDAESTTGFMLPTHMPDVVSTAQFLVKYHYAQKRRHAV